MMTNVNTLNQFEHPQTLIATLSQLDKLQPQAHNQPMNFVCAEAAVLGYGKCTQCSCPGFIGSGSTCNRSGCGHHYDEHW